MCGIIGYSGYRPAASIVIEGLRRLEYRGYDSAGIALAEGKHLHIVRAAGKLSNLEEKLAHVNVSLSTTGMGHTRWATHGAPEERNSHPHSAQDGSLAVVHNGIIENYQELKSELIAKGYSFASDTDTEVCANLLCECRKQTSSLSEAISATLARIEGAYALVICAEEEPDVLYAVRQSSPLVLGVGQHENFLASDIPAFLPYTRQVVFLEDGEMVRISGGKWHVMDGKTRAPIEKTVEHIEWDVQSAQKDGFKHFMLKEIFEQPHVISQCAAGRVDWKNAQVHLPEVSGYAVPKRLHIVACGTSYHAGLWGKTVLEQWARVPVSVEIASEFRYAQPIIGKDEALLVISQSGETADTLAVLRLAKERDISVFGLCNVVGSSIAREADAVLFTQAGPEISVASTKAMCSQMVTLVLLALFWAQQRKTMPQEECAHLLNALQTLPQTLEKALPDMHNTAKKLARRYADAHSFFYLGRGQSWALALEGALKLKEISYIHAEGYAAGEMKHGPIALIDPAFPTLAIAMDDELYAKLASNLQEVQARSGKIIAITHENTELATRLAPQDNTPNPLGDAWIIPKAYGVFASLLALPALQLFSYEVAEYLGKDVDQPRNLAKSVTVE